MPEVGWAVDGLEADDPGQIGSFRLLGRLGAGGMGRVYLGTSPGGRKVAIKVVHPQFAGDPEFRRRFTREVEAARQVGGFHTALVVDADPGADPPWMATAYIPGPSLAAAIAQRGPLDEAGTRELGAALAEGLAAIHACRLIHRDLKPSNVILADDGPRIIDFGIAKGAGATALTGSSAVIGTLQYMSPEQLQGQELTPPSDVFALGTILACAATGRHPFDAPTTPAVITRILSDPPSLGPLAGELRDIIAECLAKEPHSRPSPADLLARLSPPAPGTQPARTISRKPLAAPWPPPDATVTAPKPASPLAPFPTTPPREGSPGGQPHPRGHRRRTALIAAGATAAVALAVILGILLPDNHPASNHPSSSQPASSPPASSHPASTSRGTLTGTLADPADGGVESVAFGPGSILATGNYNGTTSLWDIATKQKIATLADPASKGIWSVAIGPGGILAVADEDGNTYLWNTATRQKIAALTDPSGQGAFSVAFEPGGTLFVGDEDGNVYEWDTATRHVTATLTAPSSSGAVKSMAFGPGGVLATGDLSSGTYLWNTATRHVTATLSEPADGNVSSVAFGPGGILATGDVAGGTYLWNTATRQVTATPTSPSGQSVFSVAFGPGGVLAIGGGSVLGSGSGSTSLWDTATRHIIATLTDPSRGEISSVAFGPGGILAVGDLSGSTYLWKITGH
jgi:serine/threonine protein kinase